jgi:hypothetical protein
MADKVAGQGAFAAKKRGLLATYRPCFEAYRPCFLA